MLTPLILVACWVAVLWIYLDLKKWRKRGVPVTPGLTALKYLVIPWILTLVVLGFLLGSSLRSVFGNSIYAGWLNSLIPLVLPIASLLWYDYQRSSRYARLAAMDRAPLPPAPAWTKWLFFILFFLPLIIVIALVILILFIFKPFRF